jgi:hypothetical protein
LNLGFELYTVRHIFGKEPTKHLFCLRDGFLIFDEIGRGFFDILLRLKPEESRAVRVSGLQPGMPPLCGSLRLTQSSWSVAV